MADTKISAETTASTLTGTELVPVVQGGNNRKTTAAEIGALQPTIADGRILGNNTGSTGTPVALTAAQVKTLLSIATSDITGLGSLATASSVGSAQITDGSIVNGDINAGAAIALSKLATMTTARLLGNVSGSAAAPAELTAAQAKSLLAVTSADLSDFGEAVQDTIGALASGGAGLTMTYNDGANTWLLDVNVDGSTIEISTDTLRIKDAGVTLAKIASIGAGTILGNNTAGSAAPSALTAAQVKTLLGTASTDISDFTEAVQDIVGALGFGGSGLTATYNDGVGTLDLSVNVDGTTIEIATDTLRIKDGGVSLAKLASIANGTILGNNTGSTAAPVALTGTQIKTLLAIAAADVSGLGALATLSTVGSAQITDGAIVNADINASAAIALSKLATVTNNRLVGNVSGSTAVPTELTAAQAKTMLAITGADVANTAAGNVAATTVQAAINELDTEKAALAGATFTGGVTATNLSASGLTGATQTSRYVGATASGAPVSGTFAAGDWVIARDGQVWVCTGGGSPGTWAAVGTAGAYVALTGNQTVAGEKTFTNLTYHSTSSTDTTPWNRPPDLAVQNTSSTNNNYMTVGSLDAAGTVASGLAFQVTNQTSHLGKVTLSTRTSGGFAARLTVDDTITVATGTVLVAPLVANSQTGTAYTLVLTDAGKIIEASNASAITITVPPNSSVAFPIGTTIPIYQQGAGKITVSPGSGVTIRTSSSSSTRAQFSEVCLRKRGTDEWVLTGDLT